MEIVKRMDFDSEEIWFTSDTHFCHGRIIEFCGRPFADGPQMDQELIKRWNETVPEDGVVFHLGDFCHGNASKWKEILSTLHGKIYLVLGNHDMKHMQNSVMSLFEAVSQQMTIRVGGRTIVLNHNPFLCYGGAYREVWQLFGHVHSGPFSRTGLDLPRLRMLFPRQYDVGVDNNDFRPVSFQKVQTIIGKQLSEARASLGLSEGVGYMGTRRVVFIGPGIRVSSSSEKSLKDEGIDLIAINEEGKEKIKDAIASRVSLIEGNVRYVYIGEESPDDFRYVHAEEGIISVDIVRKAIDLL